MIDSDSDDDVKIEPLKPIKKSTNSDLFDLLRTAPISNHSAKFDAEQLSKLLGSLSTPSSKSSEPAPAASARKTRSKR